MTRRPPTKVGIECPDSVTSMRINAAGLVAALLVYSGLSEVSVSPLWTTLGCMATLAVTIVGLEMTILRTHRRSATGLRFEELPPRNVRRVLTKLTGFYATLALIGTVYWLADDYSNGFFDASWEAIRLTWPYAVALNVLYFFFVDRRMVDPYDGYWQLGCLLTGRPRALSWDTMKQHLLGWAVKGFFLPLMFRYLVSELSSLQAPGPGFIAIYAWLFAAIFVIDLLITSVGYVLTCRLFDSHIRSTDPTFGGWAVTIICYYPIWEFISTNYLSYDDGFTWGPWLREAPTLRVVWGSAIILLCVLYVWATVPFGIRFSNLTHRGILTNGPYRYTKHPAYVAKNLSWWLIAVPFLPVHGWDDALRQSLMLLAVNLIYYLRAVTEERHLSRDPDYVRYAIWMNDHSVFRFAGRWVPFLKYRAPESAEDR